MLSSNLSDNHSDKLILTISERDNYDAQIAMKAYSENFQIEGKSYFNINEISYKINRLKKFPLEFNTYNILEGGYFDEISHKINVNLLSINIIPIGSIGDIMMDVQAFSPYLRYHREGYGKWGRCQYFITYESLKEFISLMEELLLANLRSVVFDNFLKK